MGDKKPKKTKTKNPCSSPPDLPPEMMEKILEYLPLKDLLSCRLVWKGHDAIMKEVIAKKMKPILFNVKTEGLREHLKNYPNSPVPNELQLKLTFEEDHDTIKEICENLRGRIKHLTVDMSRNYRYGDREVEGIITNHAKHQTGKFYNANARLLIHILEIFGESVETLGYGSFHKGFLQTAIGLAKKSSAAGNFNFPSVEKIRIFGESPEGQQGTKDFSTWNQLIFKSCEKLKSFQLQLQCSISRSSKEPSVLKDLNEAGRLIQITSLGLQLLESRRQGRNLEYFLKFEDDGGLQIEELHIDQPYSSDADVEKMERILEMLNKKLKVFSMEGSGFKDIKMPVMERLTSLKLRDDRLLQKICFSKITPKLKSLEVEIRKTDGEGNVFKFATTKPFKTLETLKIYPETKYWEKKQDLLNVRMCEMFANEFPCITSLTLGNPSEDFLKKLGTVWTNLLMLDLTLPEEFKDLDQSLFGITPEWKKSVDKNVDQWWTLNQPPPDSQESICSLRKLQTLRIHRAFTPEYKTGVKKSKRQPARREIESNFSEFSYFYGLKNLKQLKVFSMNQGSIVPYEEEISVEAREFIRGELPALRIH